VYHQKSAHQQQARQQSKTVKQGSKTRTRSKAANKSEKQQVLDYITVMCLITQEENIFPPL